MLAVAQKDDDSIERRTTGLGQPFGTLGDESDVIEAIARVLSLDRVGQLVDRREDKVTLSATAPR